jgi:flagellar basal-body rod protein FlgC
MISALDIAASGLSAQRTRITAISNNLANMSTTRNEAGQPEAYRPRFVVFEADDSVGGAFGAAGVRVSSVETANVEPRVSYQPNHPDADADGYVEFPNINMMAEFTNAIEASRAYEANVGVIEITKDMAQQTLRILA